MKRLVLVSRPAAGGMRAHIISLLRLLDRPRWEPTLAAPEPFLSSLPADLPPYYAITLNIAPTTSPSDWPLASQLSRSVGEIRADTGDWPIVHAHGLRAGWVCAWANLSSPFPLVVTLHNIPPNGGLAGAALGFIARRAAQIVCVSQSISERVPGRNKRVIPNGIDLARFAHLDKAGARKEFQIAPGSFAVATAARLSQEKGIDILLQAAADLPDMEFLIAGSGPEERRLAEAAPKNVLLMGRIENVETLFAACDVAVVPSRSEGQGIAALEAMAGGAAVIATNVGGLGEMVRHEETGLVVPPENPNAISQALIRLRDDGDLRERIAASGREYVTTHADERDMIAALEEVYEAAARSRV